MDKIDVIVGFDLIEVVELTKQGCNAILLGEKPRVDVDMAVGMVG